MSQAPSLEETTIKLLEHGPRPKTALIAEIKQKTGATIQGIYKALRSLREAEVITLHNKIVSLSFVWITAQFKKYRMITEIYQTPGRAAYFLELKAGEHISFKFRTLRELDLFWTHAFLLLEPQIATATPVYSIIPHDWFTYARPASDQAWVEQLETRMRIQRVVITHSSPLDKKVLNGRKSKLLEFVLGKNPLHQDERTYLNILDPWIFEARIDKKTNALLLDWIRNNPDIASRKMADLENIFKRHGVSTLKISCNPRRAKLLTRKVQKYFVF
ncbi:MAG: hypothetical protein A3D65_06360 [Candidatus Lloydbacteria bacterium RIFCSPHIGHO2_02_FULL_50_13]|uniref:Uncharacterized protein n=1 Tax=Candidatus Lloydbacteria bacterium RIFCSPHIGHO2_02_FULL_50_13 TaxID=1798661 RepID=A0A1G2D1D2_9BACT|nr:MAG: hypothetical protein A3D65_06360 [Candidatus Lloydbacteria bacterium RIFCSPHIGHO2_02_FULL_50_13]